MNETRNDRNQKTGGREPKLGYFCLIPAPVMMNRELPDKAKLLCGYIYALANQKGYCWAENGYFEGLLDCTDRTIRNLLDALLKTKYIRREFIDDQGQIINSQDNPKQIMERRLYIENIAINMKFRNPSQNNAY
jgi:hypothetical protein